MAARVAGLLAQLVLPVDQERCGPLIELRLRTPLPASASWPRPIGSSSGGRGAPSSVVTRGGGTQPPQRPRTQAAQPLRVCSDGTLRRSRPGAPGGPRPSRRPRNCRGTSAPARSQDNGYRSWTTGSQRGSSPRCTEASGSQDGTRSLSPDRLDPRTTLLDRLRCSREVPIDRSHLTEGIDVEHCFASSAQSPSEVGSDGGQEIANLGLASPFIWPRVADGLMGLRRNTEGIPRVVIAGGWKILVYLCSLRETRRWCRTWAERRPARCRGTG